MEGAGRRARNTGLGVRFSRAVKDDDREPEGSSALPSLLPFKPITITPKASSRSALKGGSKGAQQTASTAAGPASGGAELRAGVGEGGPAAAGGGGGASAPVVAAGSSKAGRGKAYGARAWLRICAHGQVEVIEADKHAIMRRCSIPAREFRILDPHLSYTSAILGRDKAIVVNLEHIKCIIMAEEVLLLQWKHPLVGKVAQELKQRLLPHAPASPSASPPMLLSASAEAHIQPAIATGHGGPQPSAQRGRTPLSTNGTGAAVPSRPLPDPASAANADSRAAADRGTGAAHQSSSTEQNRVDSVASAQAQHPSASSASLPPPPAPSLPSSSPEPISAAAVGGAVQGSRNGAGAKAKGEAAAGSVLNGVERALHLHLGPSPLPFEFRALEVCLESVCGLLDSQVWSLEEEAYPALDELTATVSTLNLERVRHIKNKLVAISGRVQKVRDELEQLLDDDEDMDEMYLTVKRIEQLRQHSLPATPMLLLASAGSHGSVESTPTPRAHLRTPSARAPETNAVLRAEPGAHPARLVQQQSLSEGGKMPASPEASSSSSSSRSKGGTKKWDVEELEMLLEAYFVQTEGSLNKLSALREYVNDTEDYINIMLDEKQNSLLQLNILIQAATLSITFFLVVTAALAMNIPCTLFDHDNPANRPPFYYMVFFCTAGVILLFLAFTAYMWLQGLISPTI